MQSVLPALGRALRYSTKRSPALVASVIGVTVSRLHALVVIARLKRKGISGEAISTIAAPGAIPEGVFGNSKSFASPSFQLAHGDSVEVCGALRDQLATDETGILEESLKAIGLSPERTSGLAAASQQGQVVLWIEIGQSAGLSVILDIFEANGVAEIFALPHSNHGTSSPREKSSRSSNSDSRLPGALLA